MNINLKRFYAKRIFTFGLFFISVFSYAQSATNMVRINGGTFTMGSPSGETRRHSNETQRQVTLSPFYMGRYEVTQAEFQAIMGTNPSQFQGPNLPVENVSWFDAIEFCNILSLREGLRPAYTINGNVVSWDRNANGYRLPTEAEWEFSCRAGSTTPFNTGDNITTDQANFNGNHPYIDNPDNPPGVYRGTTVPVGSFAPNAFGLYDMHGNVGEWCWDWNVVYSLDAEVNPQGTASGHYRVFRGGSWNHPADFLRSARRGGNLPHARGFFHGFRLARNVN